MVLYVERGIILKNIIEALFSPLHICKDWEPLLLEMPRCFSLLSWAELMSQSPNPSYPWLASSRDQHLAPVRLVLHTCVKREPRPIKGDKAWAGEGRKQRWLLLYEPYLLTHSFFSSSLQLLAHILGFCFNGLVSFVWDWFPLAWRYSL